MRTREARLRPVRTFAPIYLVAFLYSGQLATSGRSSDAFLNLYNAAPQWPFSSDPSAKIRE